MTANPEIERRAQLGTDFELDRKSGQRSGDGNGTAARAFVVEAVSAKSAANHLYPLWCAAVSGCKGEIR
jgi:hypothetical protein